MIIMTNILANGGAAAFSASLESATPYTAYVDVDDCH
jgi:hypothetical protein